MKICYFHPNTIRSSWTLWAGARAMRRLGHDVIDAPVPTTYDGRVAPPGPPGALLGPWSNCPQLPSLDEVIACDRIIVCAPEYIAGWLRNHYTDQAWDPLDRWGIFVESSDRSDRVFDYGWHRSNYSRCWFPDAEDAQNFDAEVLPPFVDCSMFHPPQEWDHVDRNVEVGFMGTLYQKRAEFLQGVKSSIVCGQVSAYSLVGEAHEKWTELYRDALWSMRIHVDLPSNNPMMTSRPFETMAAGTCLVTWALLPPPFIPSKHYVRYTTPASFDMAIEALLADDYRRRQMENVSFALVNMNFDALDGWRKILAAP